jgi:hypothetical protein
MMAPEQPGQWWLDLVELRDELYALRRQIEELASRLAARERRARPRSSE